MLTTLRELSTGAEWRNPGRSGTVVPVTAVGQARAGTSVRVPRPAAAMLATGALAVPAPAVAEAGWWAPVALALTAVVVGLTVLSVVDVTARLGPGTGYAHVRAKVGVVAGRLAGVLGAGGRVVAAAAVACAAGAYALPGRPAVAAVVLVVVAGASGLLGARTPAAPSIVVMITLAVFAAAGLAIAPEAQVAAAAPGVPGADDPTGLLAAAGMSVLGFVGVERVAAERGRARPALLLVAVLLGALFLVVSTALRQLGGPRLALSPTPLGDALVAADGAFLVAPLTIGLVVAAFVALRALMGGTAEILRDMAASGDLPARAGGRAPLLWAVAAAGTALALPPGFAAALAATLLLGHLALVNAAARGLLRDERRCWLRTGCCGIVLCVVLGVNISVSGLLVAVGLLVAGAAACTLCARGAARTSRTGDAG